MVELAEAANANVTYQLERGLGSTGQGPVVLDFTGTTLKFRSQAAIALNPQRAQVKPMFMTRSTR